MTPWPRVGMIDADEIIWDRAKGNLLSGDGFGLDVPRVEALAIKTTVSLMPRSPSLFRLSPISLINASSISFSFSLSRFSRASFSSLISSTGASGDSYSRKKRTKTAGTNSACFRTQTGATKPSG